MSERAIFPRCALIGVALALCCFSACATPTSPSFENAAGTPPSTFGGTGGALATGTGGSFAQAGAPFGSGGSSGQIGSGASAGTSPLPQGGASSGGSFGAGAAGGASGGSGASFGGRSTGGASGAAGTSGASSNDGACANPVEVMGTNTENFGTLGPACFRTKTTFSGGWNCSSTDGRVIRINGHVLACGMMPVPPQIGGYTYIEATAGTYTWAQVYWWM